jgi:hypothetical protein
MLPIPNPTLPSSSKDTSPAPSTGGHLPSSVIVVHKNIFIAPNIDEKAQQIGRVKARKVSFKGKQKIR